jgi:hypothetical protein
VHAEAELAVARAKASDDQALIAHQQLRIEKLTRQLYGPRSERTSRLLDQTELQFEELESSATEDEIAAEMAVAKTTTVAAFIRKRPARKPFPEHLPRERVIVPGPAACLCCGGERLRKLGEDVTETLEVIPRQWKVIRHVREKFTCRDCEKISQAPAPFHVIARGWAGPSLLAMVLFEKFGQHLRFPSVTTDRPRPKSRFLKPVRHKSGVSADRRHAGGGPAYQPYQRHYLARHLTCRSRPEIDLAIMRPFDRLHLESPSPGTSQGLMAAVGCRVRRAVA